MVEQQKPEDRRHEQVLAAMRQAPGRTQVSVTGGGNGQPVVTEPKEAPIATILNEWIEGTVEHYQREEREVTRRWATAMLDIDRRRSAYYQQMLGPLVK